jgi:hypothetical protein
MSGRLVSAVFDSALAAWLKPYAAAFASFALDDGTHVFPTVARIGRMVGKSTRQARRATTELRRLQVLTEISPSGRNTATRYQFHVERLPLSSDGSQLVLVGFPQSDRATVAGPLRFPQLQQALTGHACPSREDTRVRRSVS